MTCGEHGCVHTHEVPSGVLSEAFRLTAADLSREARRAVRAGDLRRARVYGLVLHRRLQASENAREAV